MAQHRTPSQSPSPGKILSARHLNLDASNSWQIQRPGVSTRLLSRLSDQSTCTTLVDGDEILSHGMPSIFSNEIDSSLFFDTLPQQSLIESNTPVDSSTDKPCDSYLSFTPEASPSLPVKVVHAAAIRNGLDVLKRSSNRPRAANDCRIEKKRKKSRKQNLILSIVGPLSEIAQNYPHAIVGDAASFATRSVEARRREAEESGKIKRPLNAFMLYRKAYQDVAKTQCSRNNHQQVSTVCGNSWKTLEPTEICDLFKEYAELEKRNHEEAFPDYKYIPVQAKKYNIGGNLGRSVSLTTSDHVFQKVGQCHEEEKRTQRRESGAVPHEMHQAANSATFPLPEIETIETIGSYETWRPHFASHRQTEQQYSKGVLNIQQYQYIDTPTSNIISSPGAYTQHQSYELLSRYDESFFDGCIDPSLLPGAPGLPVVGPLPPYLLAGDHSNWQPIGNFTSDMIHMMPEFGVTEAHNAYLKGNEGDWGIEQLDEDCEFNDWIAQTEAEGS